MESSSVFRLVAAMTTLVATVVMADPMQSHDSIRSAAESFITGEVLATHDVTPTVKAGHLDSRLRLAPCDEPLETFMPAGGRTLGSTIVGVRCSGTRPWNIYVPVKVSLFADIVVASRPLSDGRILRAEDIKLVERDIASLHSGYYTDSVDVVGKKTRRAVTLGTVITTAMIKEPVTVKRGQRVSLVAATRGMEVRMAGVAMTNGATGERIEVRNLSSKKIVEGTVLSAAAVQVNM